ncbi:Integral membrane protein TerC family protein [compost metagenome]
MFKYFTGSFVFTFIGLIGSFFVGQYYGGNVQAGLEALFIASVLAVLEISLSFDNAIVNAVVLKEMTPVWRHRFLTWGMIIAVFGMRLVFPLAIVSVMAEINPWAALVLAATRPDDYAKLMLEAHTQVSAFGGTFLLMVALKYFYDGNKHTHWITLIEKPVSYLGKKIESIEICLVLVILISLVVLLPASDQLPYLKAGMYGLITYVIVDGVGSFLEASDDTMKDMHKASAGMFLYLEVLDASFSFDGVVGAFAITHNLFIIMIGLSIGAFFVRSLTIMFVEKEALTNFLYLEHGAFYAIGILSMIMLTGPFLHIPEWITGLVGAVVIIASFIWSLRARRESEGPTPIK